MKALGEPKQSEKTTSGTLLKIVNNFSNFAFLPFRELAVAREM